MDKFSRKIFKKLCSYVGADLDTILAVCDGQWPYDKYEWTMKQENNFSKWLSNELSKKPGLSRGADMFILSYGWKIKKEGK